MSRNKQGNDIVVDNKPKNFNMTVDDFKELQRKLKEGDEQLFEQIYLAHVSECISFLQRNLGAGYEECYDATMETLLNMRRGIILDKIYYGNLRFIFTRMAKFHLLKIKGKTKEFSTDEIELYQIADEPPPEKNDDQFDMLKDAISTLKKEEQALLIAHFYNKEKLIDIGKSQGVSDATMRKRKQRILMKLRNIFQDQI